MATHISLNSITHTLTHGIVLSSMDQPLPYLSLTHAQSINLHYNTVSLSLAERSLFM